jgi:hypothetical protein
MMDYSILGITAGVNNVGSSLEFGSTLLSRVAQWIGISSVLKQAIYRCGTPDWAARPDRSCYSRSVVARKY